VKASSQLPKIRVLVADDHAILRDGICSLLERQPDIEVVGEASNGQEALELAAQTQPDIVLMDIAMPEMDGMQATRLIKERLPGVRILILTQHDNPEFIRPLIQGGASGYVLKKSGGKEVLNALRQVYEQGAFLEPSIARQLLDEYQHHEERHQSAAPHLTEREMEILKLIIAGKSNKEIAQILVISHKTVSVHRSNIMAKFEVHNSLELIRYVSRHKLLDIQL
jgi:DNA-binding NarL/FixJ family response regulator